MTPEQLEQIEKLAEAAMPGPWITEGETWEEVDWADDYQPMPRPYTLTGPNDKTIWSSGGGEYAYPDDATAAFIVAMREHALPLVKALREAREDARKHREDALAWMQVSFANQKERDEARAEVERLRGIVEVNDQRLAAVWDESRDEARAEVARLQAQVEWLLEGREQQEQRLAVEVDE